MKRRDKPKKEEPKKPPHKRKVRRQQRRLRRSLKLLIFGAKNMDIYLDKNLQKIKEVSFELC